MATFRKQQADRTKMKIFAAVTALLESKSEDAITIREICAKADVSIGSFYHYFNGKDDVLVLFYDQMDGMAKNISQRISGLNVSAYNQLLLYFVLHAQHVNSGRLKSAQLLMDLQLRHPSLRLFTCDRLPYKNAHKLIDDCISEGSLVGVEDPGALCDLLQASLRGLWFDWGFRDDPYDICERMLYYVVTSLHRYTDPRFAVTHELICRQVEILEKR